MACESEALASFIEDAGLSYKQNSVSFIFDCPRCRKKDKLYMRKRDGKFICWFCATTEGYRGNPEIALSDLAQRSIRDVVKALYGSRYQGPVTTLNLRVCDFYGDDDIVDPDAVDVPTMQMPHDYFPIDHEFAKIGAEYLAGRGIPLEVAKRYNLHYAPVKRRVVFPVELDGRLVGWQERLVVPNRYWNEEQQKFIEAPKMLSSRGIPTANVVMFADRLKGSDHVVVCEGPIDAIKMDWAGGNVATMGKAIGPGQVKTLRDPSRLTRQHVGIMANSGIKRVFLALDPDAAAENARLVRAFSDLEVFQVVVPAGYKDIGELTFQQARDAFKNAQQIGPGAMFLALRKR